MITDKLAVQSDTPIGNAPATANAGAASAASDFQSFLMLLTAQLRHQDPLSPLDSTQFVSQLANFSSVEQQIETNKLLETLNSKIAGSGLEEAAQWIGKEVEIVSGAAQFEGESLSYKIPAVATDGNAEFIVTNSSGEIVHKEGIPSGKETFIWDGRNDEGDIVPNGDYLITVNYRSNGEIVESRPPIAVSQVSEARLVDSQVKLALRNGAVIETGDIIAVRESEAATGDDQAS